MIRSTIIGAGAAVGLFALAACGCASCGVQVVDTAGRPVAGARVEAVSASITAWDTTNSDGRVNLPSNIQGAMWVAVTKPGYQRAWMDMPRDWPLRILLLRQDEPATLNP